MSDESCIASKELSRRTFVKGSAAAATATASAALLGSCAPQSGTGTSTKGSASPVAYVCDSDKAIIEGAGTWVPVSCWHNCGGKCANYAYVVDGKVIRQKTDDTHEDSILYPQQRSCPRGHSQRQHVLGPDRVEYPMKRKNWEPHTGGDKSLRGRDEWERISVDEAIELVTEELRHAYETYGARSVLHPGLSGMTPACAVLNLMGGHVGYWGTGSEGTFRFTPSVYYGWNTYLQNEGNDRFTMQGTDTVVFYGCNPVWSSAGLPSYLLMNMKRNGVEFVSVGPMYDASAAAFDATWVPVRVGTDCAFLAAVAYEMLRLDGERGDVIDWDFLHRCCVGFDAESMPADAKVPENFKDYVQGVYDGIPKTPAWASEICGTPVEQITWFAELLAKDNKVTLGYSYAPARQKNAESFPQMIITLGCMGGHMGREGHGWSSMNFSFAGNDGWKLFKCGSDGTSANFPPNPLDDEISGCEFWRAVRDGKYNFTAGKKYQPGQERDLDIHLIYMDSSAFTQTMEDSSVAIEVLRSVDFVVTNSFTMRPEARYADIVLPVTTPWEKPGTVAMSGMFHNREFFFAEDQAIEPFGESKSDTWWAVKMMDELGFDGASVFPVGESQARFNQLSTSQVVCEDGVTWENLISFTAEEIEAMGAVGEPQEGRIPYTEFAKTGTYQIERHEGDNYGAPRTFEAFRADPEGNPRASKSGKIEIYSDTFADMINGLGYNAEHRIKPYPTYQAHAEGYEETFIGGAIGGEKGEYRFQVFNPHYLRSSHATLGNVSWLQEAWLRPVFMNAQDAKDLGIEDGDAVELYNDNGRGVLLASVTNTIMPGTLALPHGGWISMNEEAGIDEGACENILTSGANTSVSGVMGFNSCLVGVRKHEGSYTLEYQRARLEQPVA